MQQLVFVLPVKNLWLARLRRRPPWVLYATHLNDWSSQTVLQDNLCLIDTEGKCLVEKNFKLKSEPKRSWAITRISTSHYLPRDIYPNLGRDIVGKYSDEKNPERKQISGLLQQLQPSVAFKSQDSHPPLWSSATLIFASKLFSDLPHLDHDRSALHVTRQRLSKLVHCLHSESVPGWVAADHHCCHPNHLHLHHHDSPSSSYLLSFFN